jgi:hypothetical protein
MRFMARAVALVGNEIDRSHLSAVRKISFFTEVVEFLMAAPGAELAIVDLTVPGALQALAGLKDVSVGRIVAYGPHVDRALLASAQAGGADAVWPRSQFLGRGLREKLT